MEKILVSQQFRSLLLETYPSLENNTNYLKLAAVLLFSSHIDESNGGIIVSSKLLADIEGKRKALKGRNYVAKKFLLNFCNDVFPPKTVKVERWTFTEHLARTVQVMWDEKILNALEKERSEIIDKTEKVFLISGKCFTAREYRKIINKENAEVNSLLDTYLSEAKPLLDYLNTIPSNIYELNMNKYYSDAYKQTLTIPEENKRIKNLKILCHLKDHPRPIYRPVINGNTERIFQQDKGYLSLRKNIRKELTKDWYEYDLQSAQLAICARLWNISPVLDFLNSKKNIWEELFEWFEWDYSLKTTNPQQFDLLKRPLKEALYALQFGMSRKNLEGLIYSDSEMVNNCIDPFFTFMSNPIIEAIYSARQEQIKTIEEEGKAATCFGKELKVTKEWKKQKGSTERILVSNIPSILAEQAQAMELYLLLPVVDIAQNNYFLRGQRRHFSIVMWCHDGFIVHYHDKRRIADIEKNMKDAVSIRADKAKIITKLVCDNPS